VCDVHIGHDPVVVADDGGAVTIQGAAIDRAIFAYGVTVADDELGRFALIFLVLRDIANGCELEYAVVFTYARRAVDDHVRSDPRAAVDLNVRTDYGERPHVNRGREAGPWIDHCARIDQRASSLKTHMRSALAASSSPTFAVAWNNP
jgi:hypothetical protein